MHEIFFKLNLFYKAFRKWPHFLCRNTNITKIRYWFKKFTLNLKTTLIFKKAWLFNKHDNWQKFSGIQLANKRPMFILLAKIKKTYKQFISSIFSCIKF